MGIEFSAVSLHKPESWARCWRPTGQVNSKQFAPLWPTGHLDPKKAILWQAADRSG